MKFIGQPYDPSLKELNEFINASFAMWLKKVDATRLWASCASCANMRKEGSAFCQKYNLTPPVNIIVGKQNCEGYENDDEIPF